jgi:hypothetical protein
LELTAENDYRDVNFGTNMEANHGEDEKSENRELQGVAKGSTDRMAMGTNP